MSWRSDSSQLIAGSWLSSAYAGHGIQAQDIQSTGTSGAGYLYNDISAEGAAPTDEMRGELLTLPAGGTLTVNEDSSFSFTGAPDGTYTFDYRGFLNGATYGDFTVTLEIGGGSNTLAADGGSWTYTGGNANTAYNRKLSAGSASWSFAVGEATMTYSPVSAAYVLSADGGQWPYAGADATLRANRAMVAAGGSRSYVGGSATLRYSGAVTLHISGYTISYAGSGITATFN